MAVIKYTLARLVLFVLAVTVLGLLGFTREVALLGGLLISVLLSYLLLRRLREPATAAIAQWVEPRRARRRASRIDEDALVEDAQDDARRERQDGPGSSTRTAP